METGNCVMPCANLADILLFPARLPDVCVWGGEYVLGNVLTPRGRANNGHRRPPPCLQSCFRNTQFLLGRESTSPRTREIQPASVTVTP